MVCIVSIAILQIIIIMDQLAINHKHQLSTIFQNKFNKNKAFMEIIQSQHLLLTITSFLQVPDLLKFSLTNKQVKELIDKKPAILNRILRAQVNFLTHQQDIKLRFSPIASNQNRSVYSLFESYSDSLPRSIESRVERMQNNKQKANDYSIFKIIKIRELLQKKSKQQQKQEKQEKKLNNRVDNNNINEKMPEKTAEEFPKNRVNIQTAPEDIDQYMKNDQFFQKISQWQKRVQQKQLREKIKKMSKAPIPKVRKEVIERIMQKEQEKLILRRETFWDRIKKRISQAF